MNARKLNNTVLDNNGSKKKLNGEIFKNLETQK